MTRAMLDPALIGIWIVPGRPFTYEISADGGYHVAEPDERLSFERRGAVMMWGGRRHERDGVLSEVSAAEALTPVGRWRETGTGDIWVFKSDGSYSRTTPDGTRDGGIWATRGHDTRLWTRERRAEITADGAHLTFAMSNGEVARYGYAVEDGVLCLLDPKSWKELSRFVSATRLAREA